MISMMFALPLTDPITIFLVVLLIILFASLMNRMHIPQIIGLILFGVLLGPSGLGVLDNDRSFALFGKVGLLYIMFQVGLDVDLNAFKLQRRPGILFGLYTFFIPLILGVVGGRLLLGMQMEQALLLSTMMSCHTLLAYPIVGKMGINDNRAINIVITGTIIAVTASLLLIAGVVGGSQPDDGGMNHWVRMAIGTVAFAIVVFLILPRFSAWFFRKFSDGVSQYIYVLAAVFASSLAAQAAGLEGIIGAFFAGLVLNRFVKPTSALMNRISFVGNAIFIPFFLISIGMLIDPGAFLSGPESIYTAVVMSSIALLSKWLSAKIAEWSNHLTRDEGNLIFGLTSGKAAAALAAVAIGMHAGLFDETILNGTVVMILVTVMVSSAMTEKSARRIAKKAYESHDDSGDLGMERVMISVGNPETMRSLVELGNVVRRRSMAGALYALKIVARADERPSGEKLLSEAKRIAAETDNRLHTLLREDINVANCMVATAKEHYISDILVGIHQKANIADTFYGSIITSLVRDTTASNLMIYGARNRLSALERMIVVVPEGAESELGYHLWMSRVANIAGQAKLSIVFASTSETLNELSRSAHQMKGVELSFVDTRTDVDASIENLTDKDLLTVVMARRQTVSYASVLERIPNLLQRLETTSFLVIYPQQAEQDSQRWSKYSPLKIS